MSVPHLAILMLSVIDAGILLLTHTLDKTMYKPSVFMRMETVNLTLFLNSEYDEPFTRLLLSKGGTLVITIFFLTTIMFELAR